MTMHCLKRLSARFAGISAALLVGFSALPASAHHSASVFDLTKKITVHGTVEKWLWANPHSWLYMSVPQAGGSPVIWGIEAGSTGMLARTGWSAYDMKQGDEVTVIASPERDGSHVGLMDKVTMADGRTMGGGAGAAPPSRAPGAPPPGGVTAPPP